MSSAGAPYAEPDACFRSLWRTLIAAASSFAIFAAANWGMATGVSGVPHAQSIFQKVLHYVRYSLALPFLPFFLCFENLCQVRIVSRAVEKERQLNGRAVPDDRRRSLAILALCRMYIQIPQRDDSLIREHPLIAPVTEAELRGLYPQVIPSYTAAGEASSSDLEWVYFKMPETTLLKNDVTDAEAEERCALLVSITTIPEFGHLRFLRERSSFQSMITAAQAIGYVIPIIQRVTQHLDVSPIEALITCLCIITFAEVSLQIYACASYQRPLLLRLDSPQLQLFTAAPRNRLPQYEREPLLPCFKTVILLPVVGFLSGLGFSTPAYIYMWHYWIVHQVLCIVPAGLFVLGFLAASSSSVALLWNPRSMLLIANALFVSSVVVAVVATILKWEDLFRDPSKDNTWTYFFPYWSS